MRQRIGQGTRSGQAHPLATLSQVSKDLGLQARIEVHGRARLEALTGTSKRHKLPAAFIHQQQKLDLTP